MTTTDREAKDIQSVPGVAFVEILRGQLAPVGAVPDLLVEVPHGADERAHYDALRARMRGPLPDGLEEFFFVNTDVGAWAYGRATAERVLSARPTSSVLLVRSLVPRTFIDCNRKADYAGGDLGKGGLTAGVPAYVRDPSDVELLIELHEAYVRLVRRAFALVCGNGGLALVPHTYGPRTMGIERIDERIVETLRWACEPEREKSWPLRAEVDLITRDRDGRSMCPDGFEARFLRAFAGAGLEVRANDTYKLVPGSLGYEWAAMHPGRVFCLEVRRDVLVDEWRALRPMRIAPAKADRVAKVLAEGLLASGGDEPVA
jgi:hypothetical protein